MFELNLILKIIASVAFVLSLIILAVKLITKKPHNIALLLFIGLAAIVLFVVADVLNANRLKKIEQLELESQQQVVEASAHERSRLANGGVKDSAQVGVEGQDMVADKRIDDSQGKDLGAAVTGGVEKEEGEAAVGQAVEEGKVEDGGKMENVQKVEVDQQVEEGKVKKSEDTMESKITVVLNSQVKAPRVKVSSLPKAAKLNDVLIFDARGSRSKSKSELVDFIWDFVDGSIEVGNVLKHSYKEQGEYTVRLIVTDAAGGKAEESMVVKVCRPESKVKFFRKGIDNVNNVSVSPEIVSGQFEKSYHCSKTFMEAKATIVSKDSSSCRCALSLEMIGPKCHAKSSKNLSNGGEGELSVKTLCAGEPGVYTWSMKRELSGSDKDCQCSWTDVTLDVFES